jgi:hypothetical protein
MDYAIGYTSKFLQNSPAWLPPMSQAYFGTLFLVQTLRAQRECGYLNEEEQFFLDGFEKTFDFRSLAIAGPAVPYFMSLNTFSGPNETIGDITPALPRNISLTAANSYLEGTLPWQLYLPNVPHYIDQLKLISSATADFTQDTAHAIRTSIFSENAAAAAATAAHLQMPGGSYPLSYQLTHLNNARLALKNIPFPPRLSATTGSITNWQRFLRFHHPTTRTGAVTFHNWFAQVSTIMSRYAKYFRNSVSLNAIPPAGQPICALTFQYSATPAGLTPIYGAHAFVDTATNVPAHWTTTTPGNFLGHGSHKDLTNEEINEQYALLTQVNADLSLVGLNITTPVQSGPYFTLPNVRQSSALDLHNSIGPNIAQYYHTDTPSRD